MPQTATRATPRLPPDTMVYTVDLGNGHVADIEGPVGATPEQLQAVVAQHHAGQTSAPSQPQSGDQSLTTADAMQGGFADSRPYQAKVSFPDADKAHLSALYKVGSASAIVQFLTDKGFHSDPGQVALFVQQREDAKKHGGRVNYGVPTPSIPDVSAIKPGDLPTDLEPGAAQAGGRGVADDIPGIKHLTALTRTLDSKLGLAHPTNRNFGDELAYQEDLGHGAQQNDEENHPWTRIAGQLLGGLAVPTGLEGVGLRVGTDVLRTGGTMAEARAAIKVAVRNRMAAVSGTYGALHGAGEADTPGGAVTGALTEGALGGVTGGVMGQIAPESVGAAGRAAPALTDAQQVAQAAGRQGIDVLPADVGGPVTRRATSAVTQTIAGGQPIIAASERMVGQAQEARDRVAATIGNALRPEAAGQAGIRGAQSFIARTAQRARQLYGTAEAEANGAHITPTSGLAVLDRNIAELSETPGGAAGLGRLQALREALAQGDVSVRGLRNMRTALRDDFAENGLRGSDIERRVNQVIDATTQDIQTGLTAQGRGEAARLYRVADRYYRQRVDTIDNVLDPLISGKSGEQVVKTLKADLQGNNARAARFLRALPPEEQATTRASIIGGLGHATKGAQNADGDAFSLQTFLSNWNEIGDTAKAAYFGPEARAALNDLALVAQGSRAAQGYANRSNTGGALGNLLTLGTGVAGIPTFAATVGTQYGLGRLLASPRFARWLARAPRTQLAAPAYLDRLSRIARAEPAIANEVLQLQQRLESAFTSSSVPTRLAAQEPSDESNGGQGNAGEQQPQNESLQP